MDSDSTPQLHSLNECAILSEALHSVSPQKRLAGYALHLTPKAGCQSLQPPKVAVVKKALQILLHGVREENTGLISRFVDLCLGDPWIGAN